MIKKFCAVLALTTIVANCGGGGGSAPAGSANPILDARTTEALRIINDANALGQTPSGFTPPPGTVTYNGIGSIGAVVPGAGVSFAALGEATVEITFATGAVSGQVDNFVTDGDAAVAGSIVISNTGPFAGSMVPLNGVGILTDPGASGAAVNIDVDGTGALFGPNAEALITPLPLTGTATVAGVTPGTAESTLAVEQ